MACNMGDPPDVPFWAYRIFAIPPSPPKAENDNIFPPPERPAEPPPPPPPDPRLTQGLGPNLVRDGASRGHRQPLNDAAKLHALRRALWDCLDAKEADGPKVKQDPEAVDEVLRMARENLGYPGLARSRAATEVVAFVWKMRGK
jgi:hypothetical protein